MQNPFNHLYQWSIRTIGATIDEAPMSAEEKNRLRHFAVFVVIGVATMVGYGAYNFLAGNLLLGSLVFLSGSGLLFGWLLMCYLPMGQVVYRLNGLLYAGLLLYMLMLGGDGSRSLWMFTFPLIVFFLTGKREGLFWSLGLFFSAMALLLLPLPGLEKHGYSTGFIIRFATVYIIISIISFWFEFSRDHYRRELAREYRQKHLENHVVIQATERSLFQDQQQDREEP